MGGTNNGDAKSDDKILNPSVAETQRSDFEKFWTEKAMADKTHFSWNEKGQFSGSNPGFADDNARKAFEARKAKWQSDMEAAWNDPTTRANFLGNKYASSAKSDKTDSYLRNVGMKRRTGSTQSSYINQAFDPAAPIGRGNILGD
jgi:hypothetical protein